MIKVGYWDGVTIKFVNILQNSNSAITSLVYKFV